MPALGAIYTAMVFNAIPGEEKRQALQRVLESRTFARSDQLRAFLRYVCEAEFEGRAQQLNEYMLGVAVLGRPSDYSPAEDSCVRSRAYELRNKLNSYYRSEAPEDPIQIQIDKGAYMPRFERRAILTTGEAPMEAAPVPVFASESSFESSVADKREPRSRLSIVAVVISAILTITSLGFFWAAHDKPAVNGLVPQDATREMNALWHPFLDSNAPLLISFEIRLFFYAPATGLVIRDFQINRAEDASQSHLLSAFRERMNAPELRETLDYADFGAVHAVFLLGRTLKRDIALKHGISLGWEDIWNSNIIFIGKPNLNPTIRYALQDSEFVDEITLIRNLHPLPGEPTEYHNAATHGAGEKYALITVMPGPQPSRHMMILGGAGAELMWALAESVTNPTRVKEIMSHVLLPSGECPAAFQVLISAVFEANVPVKIRYVTHRVSKVK